MARKTLVGLFMTVDGACEGPEEPSASSVNARARHVIDEDDQAAAADATLLGRRRHAGASGWGYGTVTDDPFAA
jgi:hypothetical protein